jgi:superfamily I DNA/RNA helicase
VFATWAALREYVDSEQAGRDLKPFVDLIDSHGAEVIIAAIDSLVDERRADTVVSAHKAKGREWDSVQIADDFPVPVGGNEIPRSDAMLAYVAVTRARKQLDRGGLAWIDQYSRAGASAGRPIAV